MQDACDELTDLRRVSQIMSLPTTPGRYGLTPCADGDSGEEEHNGAGLLNRYGASPTDPFPVEPPSELVIVFLRYDTREVR